MSQYPSAPPPYSDGSYNPGSAPYPPGSAPYPSATATPYPPQGPGYAQPYPQPAYGSGYPAPTGQYPTGQYPTGQCPTAGIHRGQPYYGQDKGVITGAPSPYQQGNTVVYVQEEPRRSGMAEDCCLFAMCATLCCCCLECLR